MKNCQDENAKKAVKKFCDQVFWLRIVRYIYEELFEKVDSHVLMEKTGPSFFDDLNTILQNYLLLEFAKIIDPPTSGKNENFTVENLLVSVDWPHSAREKLALLNEKTNKFRGHVLKARHKLLAHMDKESFLAGDSLGGFPEGEDVVFLDALEEICNTMHEASFGSINGQMVMPHPGDVINLKRALLNGLAFDQMLSESTGKEKTRLYSYVEKIRASGVRYKSEADEE